VKAPVEDVVEADVGLTNRRSRGVEKTVDGAVNPPLTFALKLDPTHPYLAEHIVLVEGYWSAIRLHALGVPVAALMGSSVSEEQLALLRERGTRSVTLLLDGDDAGRKAPERVLPALASAFFVRAPVLPDGEKPDTLSERVLREVVNLSR
jgi:DNA primase